MASKCVASYTGSLFKDQTLPQYLSPMMILVLGSEYRVKYRVLLFAYLRGMESRVEVVSKRWNLKFVEDLNSNLFFFFFENGKKKCG